ncbi:MAG: hypothetical protein JXR70_05375 [Spirochaetales bacterium]|nr:hypothetical protein [Spirochaetales bacterium]
MSDYKNRIRSFQLAIKSNQAIEKEKTIQLGDLLSDLPKKTMQNEALIEYFTAISEARTSIPEIEANIVHIKTQLEKTSAIQQLIKDREKNIAQLKNDFLAIYEVLGQIAYNNFKNKLVQNANLEMIFKNISRLEEKEEYFQDNLKKSPADDANFLDQMAGAVKGFYQTQRLNIINRQLTSHFRSAGEKLMKMELPQEIITDELEQPISQYQQLSSQIQSIRDEINKNRQDISEIEFELKEKFPAGSSIKNISRLEKEIQSINVFIGEQLYLLGQEFLKNPQSEILSKKEISVVLGDIQSLQKERKQSESMIAKLEAAIMVEKLGKNISQSQKKIESLKNDIAKARNTIESLETEITEMDKEKKSFTKKAGEVLN